MSHLTPEQFEDILQGRAGIPEHIAQCADCRARLAGQRALARRLRQAFSSIHAGPDLAGRIRADIAAGRQAGAARGRPRIIPLHVHRYAWSALAAAAAILIVVASVTFYVDTGSQARAAQAALVGIHHVNLGSLDKLVKDEDPANLCKYLESEVGHSPAMVCTGSGLSMCGCCVRQFQGRPVASYVVEAENAPVSIIVVPHSPKALGMTPAPRGPAATRAVWQARCGGCNMASVRIGEYSYCAVGQVPQKALSGVLHNLLD